MAEYYSPEEINQIFEAYNDAIKTGTPISKELQQAMKDATIGVKGYTSNLKASMKQLGQSFVKLGSDIYDGKKGAAVFNDTLSAGGTAVAAYAAKFGPAGIALGAFTKAIIGYVGAVNKQSDALFDAYTKISRSGVVGAGAMDDVFNNMLKFGYSLDQLGDLSNLLKENSKNFGLFANSAISGAKQFGDMAAQIQDSPMRTALFNLGLTVNDINNGLAGFYKQEGAQGKLRGRSTEDLARASSAYVKEMEILTRLTGQTREEMEAQREQALNIDAFYAALQDLPEDARKEALKTFNQMGAISGKAAAEFAANFNGTITGATDLLVSTQGQALQYNKEYYAAGGKAIDAMQGMSDAARPMIDVTKKVAQVGGQFGLTTREMVMLGNKGIDPMRESLDSITNEVDKAMMGYNSATNSQAKLRDSQIRATQGMQEFVNLGINPVTKAMQLLADVVEFLVDLLPGAGRARKKRAEEAALRAGKETATTQATAAHQTNVDAMGNEMGGFGVGPGGGATLGANEILPALKIKSAEATAGGATSDQLAMIAYEIQSKLGSDLKYFSAFNDSYERGPNSLHGQGRALDFTLNDPRNADAVASMVRSIPGISKVIDEYANPSKSATGGHIHVEARDGFSGIMSGPMSGYSPSLTMHGTEAINIQPLTGAGAAAAGQDSSMMAAQLDRLDELVSVMKTQVGISDKLLRMQS
jgi:hypothetical protein